MSFENCASVVTVELVREVADIPDRQRRWRRRWCAEPLITESDRRLVTRRHCSTRSTFTLQPAAMFTLPYAVVGAKTVTALGGAG